MPDAGLEVELAVARSEGKHPAKAAMLSGGSGSGLA
jgi:hypothetical protein